MNVWSVPHPVPARRPHGVASLPDTRADQAEILTWASALMVGSKVMLIDADNQGRGWVPLEAAVRSGRPFAIKVRDDVLAVDSDKPALLPKLVDLAAALRSDGRRPVVLRSGRRGHAHLWCQIAEPALLADYKSRARELGFDVRDRHNLCRAPMSPHRGRHPVAVLGGQPETPHWQAALEETGREQRGRWIEGTLRRLTKDPTWSLPGRGAVTAPAQGVQPAVAASAISAATPAPVAAKARTLPATRSWRPISPEMARLLREGLPQGQRSEGIWAFLIWAVNSGWSFEATLALLMGASNALGEKVREKRAPRRWLEAQWNKAERFVATNPPVANRGAVLAEVARLRQGVEEDDWPGVAGTTDRQIVLVHLDIMEETGKLYHGASVREVAERAGRSAKTVTASHERQRDRWLKPAGSHRRGTMEARIWTVRTPPDSNRRRRKVTSVLTLRGGVRESVVIPRLGSLHDAFRGRGGLGLGPGLAYDVLGVVDTVDVAALIKRFGGHRSTWYRRLGRLAEHGLATRTPPGWLRGPADLDQVAEALGVAGALARQKAQHHQERKTFKEWLNEGRPLKKGARGTRRGTALDGASAHGIV